MSGDRRPSLLARLRAALAAFRDPAAPAAPPPFEPAVLPPLDEPDVSLAPHLNAVPLYDHWHPGGRTLFGWLHTTRDNQQVVGFTPYDDAGYGVPSTARSLQAQLGGAERPAFPVSRWEHVASGRHYWRLGTATAQASTGPIQDDEEVAIYENNDGRWFVRRPSEFLDGRFAPLNDLARTQLEAPRRDHT